jgi:hypothetical protein
LLPWDILKSGTILPQRSSASRSLICQELIKS